MHFSSMATYEPPYNADHLNAYAKHIELPAKFRPENNPQLDIRLLTALHVHHISTIPYENLSLHYSTHRTITLDPKTIFQNVVEKKRGRGGYCMETTLLFMWMLQVYGFDVYPVGVRIRLREDGVPKGDFVGL
jgi:arylamine N-acetyltransferase